MKHGPDKKVDKHVVVPCFPWTGQPRPSCRSEASSLEVSQLRIMKLNWAARLTAANPPHSRDTSFLFVHFLHPDLLWENNQSLDSYRPQSFLMPLWFFLFSGETGDCCPESSPEDSGDWSDSIRSSSSAGWSDRNKENKNSINFRFSWLFLLGLNKKEHLMLWREDKRLKTITCNKIQGLSIVYFF